MLISLIIQSPDYRFTQRLSNQDSVPLLNGLAILDGIFNLNARNGWVVDITPYLPSVDNGVYVAR